MCVCVCVLFGRSGTDVTSTIFIRSERKCFQSTGEHYERTGRGEGSRSPFVTRRQEYLMKRKRSYSRFT